MALFSGRLGSLERDATRQPAPTAPNGRAELVFSVAAAEPSAMNIRRSPRKFPEHRIYGGVDLSQGVRANRLLHILIDCYDERPRTMKGSS